MSALPVPSLSTTQLSLSTSPTPTLLLMAIAGTPSQAVAAIGTYIFGYIFLSGSKPGANPEHLRQVRQSDLRS
jgi:hypothetical protein